MLKNTGRVVLVEIIKEYSFPKCYIQYLLRKKKEEHI